MQTFKCEDCGAEVKYEPQVKPGGIGFQTRRLPTNGEFTVYLTCRHGHTHPYVVVQNEKGDARGG